jgi:hypothetical protein
MPFLLRCAPLFLFFGRSWRVSFAAAAAAPGSWYTIKAIKEA